MKKGIGLLILILIFVATVFGPTLVKANLEEDLDLKALQPSPVSETLGDFTFIHPAWKKLGIVPGCE